MDDNTAIVSGILGFFAIICLSTLIHTSLNNSITKEMIKNNYCEIVVGDKIIKTKCKE